MTIGQLLQPYKKVKSLPKEILSIKVGEVKYDKKYIEIRDFFKKVLPFYS